MINKHTLSWFTRGFMLTLLILLGMGKVGRSAVGWLQKQGIEDTSSRGVAIGEMLGTGDLRANTARAASGIAVQANYSSPLVIPAAAFSSEDESDQFFFNLMFGYTEGDPYACLKAPVYLPHGATITSFYAYLYDNNDPSNITVMLRRARNMTGLQADMGQISTTGTSTSIQYLGDTTISPADVSNLYSYWLSTCVNSNTRIHAVRIFYTGP